MDINQEDFLKYFFFFLDDDIDVRPRTFIFDDSDINLNDDIEINEDDDEIDDVVDLSLRDYGLTQKTLLINATKEAYKPKERDETIGKGYYLDESLSNDEFAVYKNEKNNDAIVGLRGTDLFDRGLKGAVKDIYDDIHIALLNRPSKSRISSTDTQFKKIINNLDDEGYERINISSHSLGGSIGNQLLKNNKNTENVKITNYRFNPGVVYLNPSTWKDYFFEKDDGRQMTFSTYNDPVSTMSAFMKKGETETRYTGLHSLDSFEVDETIKEKGMEKVKKRKEKQTEGDIFDDYL